MKPKPFSSLNHLTIPVGMRLSTFLSAPCSVPYASELRHCVFTAGQTDSNWSKRYQVVAAERHSSARRGAALRPLRAATARRQIDAAAARAAALEGGDLHRPPVGGGPPNQIGIEAHDEAAAAGQLRRCAPDPADAAARPE